MVDDAQIFGKVLQDIGDIVGGDANEPLAERVRGWVQAAGAEAAERRRAHTEIVTLQQKLSIAQGYCADWDALRVEIVSALSDFYQGDDSPKATAALLSIYRKLNDDAQNALRVVKEATERE